MITTHRIVSGMTAIVFAAALSGCASAPATPTVYAYPAQGQTPQQQAKDTSECQAWAGQQTGWDPATSAAEGAGIGLAVGAAAGGLGGAAYGGTSQYCTLDGLSALTLARSVLYDPAVSAE